MTHPVSTVEETGPAGKGHEDASLWRGSVWALITVATVSLGGFAFWVAAAATTPLDETVGIATAWYTLLQLTVSFAAIGLPILITRKGSEEAADQIAGSGLIAAGTVAVFAGLIAPFFASETWSSLSGLSQIVIAPVFALGALGAALTLGVDARLMSLRRWPAVFVRGTVPIALRLPLLFLDPLDDRATWIAILAIGPIALSGLVGTVWLAAKNELRLQSPRLLTPDQQHFFASQHVAALATQAPYYIIPFLVSRQVPGSLNATFYLVWGIGLMVAMVPQTLAQVLLSETSLQEHGRVSRLRMTLTANVALGIVAWAGSLVLARPVLGLIGPGYADQAVLLPWLLLAALAWGVTSICLTEARLAHDAQAANLITWTLAIGAIGGAVLVMPGRPLWGATIVWLLANLLSMTIGIVSLDRRRRTRSAVIC